MRIARPVSLSRQMERQIPVLIGGLAVLIIPAATLAVLYGSRMTPQLMAGASLLLLSAACLYLAGKAREFKAAACNGDSFYADLLVTSWVGLPNSPNKLIVAATRSIIIFSLAVFVFTVLIPRWSRPGDTWLKAFRQMVLLTTTVGIGLLATLVFDALMSDSIGRVLVPPDEAIGVFVAVLVLCGSSTAIAVRRIGPPSIIELNCVRDWFTPRSSQECWELSQQCSRFHGYSI